MKKIERYFEIRELVCPHTYDRFGQSAWMFLDADLLECLYILRNDLFSSPMIINNYAWGGTLTQRGLRCNICPIPLSRTQSNNIHLSAHTMGKAFDATIEGITAEEARTEIKNTKELLPVNFRLEDDVSWLHFDIFDTGKKLHIFKP